MKLIQRTNINAASTNYWAILELSKVKGVHIVEYIKILREWNRRRKERRYAKRELIEQSKLKLAVMGIMKNESFNIDEWIIHYKEQGADKIFLIDNGSDDDSVQKAQKYVDFGWVELIILPQKHSQIQHYNTAFKKFRIKERFQWLLIADLDEFWFCKNGDSISFSLNEYDDIDLIYVNWSIFGSDNHNQHPKSLRCNLLHRKMNIDSHKNTKYIVRTNKIRKKSPLGVHKVMHIDSSRVISDNQRFQINHYVTQSLEFFTQVKMKRGDVALTSFDQIRDLAYYHKINLECNTLDETLAKRILTGVSGLSAFEHSSLD